MNNKKKWKPDMAKQLYEIIYEIIISARIHRYDFFKNDPNAAEY